MCLKVDGNTLIEIIWANTDPTGKNRSKFQIKRIQKSETQWQRSIWTLKSPAKVILPKWVSAMEFREFQQKLSKLKLGG